MGATVQPLTWTQAGFRAAGWRGFVPLESVPSDSLPDRHGVYVVLRESSDPIDFRDPNAMPLRRRAWYSSAALESRWVEGASVLYLGKAGSKGGLRERVRAYARNASGHSGGRSIWQLVDSGQLLIAWLETPGTDPRDVEDDLLIAFERDHGGRRPFANPGVSRRRRR